MGRMRYFYFFCFSLVISSLHAQVGGASTNSFINLTPSAQVAALGGKMNAVTGNDASLSFYNPGLLDSAANNQMSFSFVDLFAGVRYGYVAYSRSQRNVGSFAAGIYYINYGKFTEADILGIITGDYTAAEYAFNFSYSRQLRWLDSTLHVGVNIKPLLSVFERYTSYGLLGDIGVTFRHPNKLFTAAAVARNFGGQLTPYSDGDREPIPFELQLGLSQRLQYAPLQFSLVIQQLQALRLGHNKVNENPAPGQPVVTEEDLKKGFELALDEAMRRLIIGVELFPFQGLTIRAGYNYNRRQDMKVDTRPAMVGFSWGVGINLTRVNINYAQSIWHLSGASNHLSLSVKLQ